MTREAQDSTGRAIHIGDRVRWRGQIYTIKAFGDPIGRCGTRAIVFEETLHRDDEIPDEIGIDLVEAAPRHAKDCPDSTPPWFVGHWREWHRGHGCNKDDGNPRSETATVEIVQHVENAGTGFLTDAELGFLRASTTSGNTLLVRALDELAVRRRTSMARRAALDAALDHSDLTAKHFEPLLGYCVCPYCQKLPEHDGGSV